MKKIGSGMVLTVLVALMSFHMAFAQEKTQELPDYLDLVFSEPITYNFFIDNERADYDLGKPFLSRDMVVMIPLRAAVERMGYTIVWNGKIRTVIVYNDQAMFILKIDRNRYYSRYNSSAVLSKEPIIKESRTYVPMEFFTTLMQVDAKIDSSGNLLMYTD